MSKLYEHKFKLESGREIFVPTAESVSQGEQLCVWVASRWHPPSYYFHFVEGGHLAAVKRHLEHHIFLRLDLERFFDRVTRTKVVRGLQSIGFKHRDALELATLSTVIKKPGEPRSLPFGFIQSPILATLAMSRSALGKELSRISKTKIGLSVYMDDIILSSNDAKLLCENIEFLERASLLCGFSFNDAKKQGPSNSITAFNVLISHKHTEITPERMELFRKVMVDGNDAQARGVIGYVSAVNVNQADELHMLRPSH